MIFSHTILIRSFSFTFPGKLLREFWRHSLGTAAPVCALILGTIGTVFFALGMCMTTITEWDMFRQRSRSLSG